MWRGPRVLEQERKRQVDKPLPTQAKYQLKFKPFTPESYSNQLTAQAEEKRKKQERKLKSQEAHLQDGRLVFGLEDDAQDKRPERNTDLESGRPLKTEYWQPPQHYLGLPLEEIDEGVTDLTFVVLSHWLSRIHIHRFTATPSFFILPPWNRVRKVAVFLCTNQVFDFFILLTIVVNSITLTSPVLNLELLETIIYGTCAAEMIIKMTARGVLIGSYTYLRDPWNWLDIFVVVSGIPVMLLEQSTPTDSKNSSHALRCLRVMRAIKTISMFPGLRTIVSAMGRASKMVFEVILLTFFSLLVFSLISVEIYKGTLRHKCVYDPALLTHKQKTWETFDEFYQRMLRDPDNWDKGVRGYVLCGNATGAGSCRENFTCQPDIGENPNYGFTNFDTILWSVLLVFQLMTVDSWENIFQKVLLTSGVFTVVFFIIVVFFGAFYLLDLMLAVVTITYQEEAERASKELELEMAFKRQRKAARAGLHNIPAMIHVQRKWIRLVQNNKEKYRLNETEIDKRKRLRNVIDYWTLCSTHSEFETNVPKGQVKSSKQYEKRNSAAHNMTQNTGVYFSARQSIAETNQKRSAIEPATGETLQSSNPDSGSANNGNDSSGTCAETRLAPDNGLNSGQTAPELSGKMDSKQNQVLGKQNDTDDSGRYRGSCGSCSSNEDDVPTPEPVEDDDGLPKPTQPVQGERRRSVRITRRHDKGAASYRSQNVKRSRMNRQAVFSLEQAEGSHERRRQLGGSFVSECSVRIFSSFKALAGKVHLILTAIVTDITFDLFIALCIVFNTVTLSLSHHGMSDTLTNTIRVGSLVVIAIFNIEALLRVVVMGIRSYFTEGWNCFDFIIAILSDISVVLEMVESPASNFMMTCRILRVLKLAQVWPAMNHLLRVVGNALLGLGQLTIILSIIVYAFAVVGMYFFGGKYAHFQHAGQRRWNFNDFLHSFMLMFRVLCGEWVEPLWDCMRARDVHYGACMVVILPSLIFGNFIVLNLFLALLLNAFGKGSQEAGDLETRRLQQTKERIKEKFQWLCKCFLRQVKPVSEVTYQPSSLSVASQSDSVTGKALTDGGMTTSADQFFLTNADIDQERRKSSNSQTEDLKQSRTKTVQDPTSTPPFCAGCVLVNLCAANSPCPGAWKKFRGVVKHCVHNDIFEFVIFVFIIASTVVLVFEDYDFNHAVDDNTTTLRDVTGYSDIVFPVLFIIEMFLRWTAFGLKKYFTSVWTIIDFIVILVSLPTVLLDKTNDYYGYTLHYLKPLRALRPIRLIKHLEGMKIVVTSLMRAIPAILNVILVSGVFWLIFSFMGVQLFAGRFYKCVDLNTRKVVRTDNIRTKADCFNDSKHYVWYNPPVNFDNVANGLLALFQVATFEGWKTIMSSAADSSEVDMQPRFEASIHAYVYFVAFIICGSFFSLNLIIGVIVDNFNALKKRYEGSYLDAFLTAKQRNYYSTLKKLCSRKPQRMITPPSGRLQLALYKASVSDTFELLMTIVVCLNLIEIALANLYYKTTCFWGQILMIVDVAFCTFFVMEAVIKIVGLRQYYFTLTWNCYDFAVAVFSVIDVSMQLIYNYVHVDFQVRLIANGIIFSPNYLRLLRVFRIGRVLRLLKVGKGLRQMIYSLVISLPGTLNIMALLMLCILVYAITGMFLFSNVKLNGTLTASFNFRTFKNSALLLLSLSTAAGWNDVLQALLISVPFCNNTVHSLPGGIAQREHAGDCGHWVVSIVYIVSYIIITYLLIINLYIAVILEIFNQVHQEEESGVTLDDFDLFYFVWQRYDPAATQFIDCSQLSDLVADVDPPLGIEKPNEIALITLNLPIREGNLVHCLDILFGLVKNVMSDADDSEDMVAMKQQLQLQFQNRFPTFANMRIISSTIQRKKEDVAARTLQRAWVSFKTKQVIQRLKEMVAEQKREQEGAGGCHTPVTVSELSDNMRLAYTRYFQKVMKTRTDSLLLEEQLLTPSQDKPA